MIWPQKVTLIRGTQSSGPLCLWQINTSPPPPPHAQLNKLQKCIYLRAWFTFTTLCYRTIVKNVSGYIFSCFPSSSTISSGSRAELLSKTWNADVLLDAFLNYSWTSYWYLSKGFISLRDSVTGNLFWSNAHNSWGWNCAGGKIHNRVSMAKKHMDQLIQEMQLYVDLNIP